MANRVSKASSCYYEVSYRILGILADAFSTLFWGGETFAPSLIVSDVNGKKANIQHVLQGAFLAAVEKLVQAVGDLDSVIGFEVGHKPFKADPLR
jgi:hypothetical protein